MKKFWVKETTIKKIYVIAYKYEDSWFIEEVANKNPLTDKTYVYPPATLRPLLVKDLKNLIILETKEVKTESEVLTSKL